MDGASTPLVRLGVLVAVLGAIALGTFVLIAAGTALVATWSVGWELTRSGWAFWSSILLRWMISAVVLLLLGLAIRWAGTRMAR